MNTRSFSRRLAFVLLSYATSAGLVFVLGASCPASQVDLQLEGTRVRRDTIDAGTTDVWTVRLRAFREARISVEADKGTLQCELRDPDHKTIELEPAATEVCQIVWTPQRSGPHQLEITNAADVPRGYTVLLR